MSCRAQYIDEFRLLLSLSATIFVLFFVVVVAVDLWVYGRENRPFLGFQHTKKEFNTQTFFLFDQKNSH